MKQRLQRSVIAVLAFISSTVNAIAGPEDNGRWYSNSGVSYGSPLGFILGGIIIVILGYILISANNEKKRRDPDAKTDNGCLMIGIIVGIIFIVIGLSRCSD